MKQYIFGVDTLPTQLEVGDKICFNYTGDKQVWKPIDNNVNSIRIECYGGASPMNGYGGYASGVFDNIDDTTTLYIYCGGRGTKGTETSAGVGGFNGGGNPVSTLRSPYSYGGGGATDIRLNGEGLSNRIIVAGGASVGTPSRIGHGGGLLGRGEDKTGGTQIRGGINTEGNNGELGIGGNGKDTNQSASALYSVGGGGGYYGGAGSSRTSYKNSKAFYNGGGSSYIGGVKNGMTFDGSSEFGNKSNGYVIITILPNESKGIKLSIIDKKTQYTQPENIKFIIDKTLGAQSINITMNNRDIFTIDNPNDNQEYTIPVSKDQFLNLPNGLNYITFKLMKDNKEILSLSDYIIKIVNDMVIITDPIEIGEPECAVDINLDTELLDPNGKIKIFCANNGFDTEPKWIDVTDRVLKNMNFLTINRTKTNPKWGLSFKIMVSGYARISEDIIGGFHYRTLPNTRKVSEQDDVYRNTMWGNTINKNHIQNTEEEIDLIEMMIKSNKDLSDSEFTPEYFQEKLRIGRMTNEQMKRLKSLKFIK